MTRPFNKKSRREENLPQNEANKMVKIFHSSHVASFMAFWRSSYPSENHAWVRFFRADEVFSSFLPLPTCLFCWLSPLGCLNFDKVGSIFFQYWLHFSFRLAKWSQRACTTVGRGRETIRMYSLLVRRWKKEIYSWVSHQIGFGFGGMPVLVSTQTGAVIRPFFVRGFRILWAQKQSAERHKGK